MRALQPVLILCFLVLVFSAIDPVWRIDPDAAAYMSLGNAVGSGEGYALGGSLHAKYPPGWPLLLAGLGKIADPTSYGLFHAVLALAWLAAVVLAQRLARRLGLGPWQALAVAACTGLSQTLFELSIRYLRTEPLFLALSLGALLTTLRAVSLTGNRGHTLLAALLTVASLSVRLAGVSLLVVPALALFRKRTRRGAAALVLVFGAAAVLGWVSWGQHVRAVNPDAPDYRTEFLAAAPRDLTKVVQTDVPTLDASGLAERVRDNVGVLARASAVLLTNVDKAGARAPVGYAALALILLGGVSLLRRPTRDDPDERHETADARVFCMAYLGATLGLYLLWPFDQQERFYVPLLPLLLVAAFQGAQRVGDLLQLCSQRPALRTLCLLGAVALLVVLAAQRSDDPRVLGRWSKAYAGLLTTTLAGIGALAWWLYRGRNLRWPAPAWLLAAALFALPFAALRFREWPALVQAFDERRAADPRTGPMARIDVHPVLEQVADYLGTTAPDTVVMTDVPKMLAILSERRCVPFVFRADPPGIFPRDADLLFYTRELPEASAVLDAVAEHYEVVLELPPVDDGQRQVTPAVYRPR